jgi:phytoene dehydrogenase-like protein
MAGLMTMTPPNIPPKTSRDWKHLGEFLWYCRKLLPLKIFTLLRLVLSDPVKYLDSWFESDVLKATLLTDAMIGAVNLSGYVLLHHVMGDAGGARGVWGYMKGGMGSISHALRLAGEAHGVKVICNAKAERIIVKDIKITGVLAKVAHHSYGMPKRQMFQADIVVSAVDPLRTFDKLLGDAPGAAEIAARLRVRDRESASMKINCTLKGLPDFTAMPGILPGPQHRGTIHISPSVEYILHALHKYKDGAYYLAGSPVLEITLPSVLDNTLAPEGKHVMNIFLQFYPYERSPGKVDKDCTPYFYNVVMPVLREYIANIDDILERVQVLAPRDLEREFGLVGGNIFHGGMGLGQLFCFRPLRGMANYRTVYEGLYLSGAGTHPGGGVTGACGYNAVREILADLTEVQKEQTPISYFFPPH